MAPARARRRYGGGARDADQDRGDRDVLAPAGVLAEHTLTHEHEHEQTGGERRLHDHKRRQQQRHDLQRPAKQRETGAEQPARPPDQAQGEPDAQMSARRRFLGVHRLERYP